MGKPWLSVIIPTIGRVTLGPLLAGLRAQAPAAALELLVVGDTHGDTWHGTLGPVPALCAEHTARYLPHDGGVHAWGHPQRTYGAQRARGAWLWWLQDDDLAAPDAYATLWTWLVATPRVPHLFRVDTWQAGRIWREREIVLGNVDADCFVAPNVPKRLAPWPPHYTGDYEMIRDTVARYGGACVWVDAVIAHGRPGGVPADVRAGVLTR